MRSTILFGIVSVFAAALFYGNGSVHVTNSAETSPPGIASSTFHAQTIAETSPPGPASITLYM